MIGHGVCPRKATFSQYILEIGSHSHVSFSRIEYADRLQNTHASTGFVGVRDNTR